MKTDYKLSRTQFEALYNIYETQVVAPLPPTLPAEKLLHTLQLQIWVKLRKLNVEYKPKYKLALTPAEEQAFMIFWGQYNLSPTTIEGNLIQTTINIIHPKYL